MPYCFLPALHLGGWSGEQVQAGCQASSAPLPGHAQPHVTAPSLLVYSSYLHLTLEQHGFELLESTSMQVVLMDNMKQILNLNKLIMKSQQELKTECILLDPLFQNFESQKLTHSHTDPILVARGFTFFHGTWDLPRSGIKLLSPALAELKQASERKLLEIQTEKNKQKEDLDSMENSDKIKTIQQNLETEIQITTVIQNVFQNLILGSKVNWAEDPALKETVLQLEKNLTMI
ncbi:hypothetical protein FD755_018616 [Muntiacus reevesi]|uniref:Centromere protein H C-terminal domain-containing protein n=1 Tax=Muntiacus reevesi TaxID=9886 RepID=A0A5N3X672_MUNRE|nr:hypothetical protein FD755_018616 [Muntiacus reevesi]